MFRKMEAHNVERVDEAIEALLKGLLLNISIKKFDTEKIIIQPLE